MECFRQFTVTPFYKKTAHFKNFFSEDEDFREHNEEA